MARDGDMSADGMRFLLDCKGECEWLDFKQQLTIESDAVAKATRMPAAKIEATSRRRSSGVMRTSPYSGFNPCVRGCLEAAEGIGESELTKLRGIALSLVE